MRSNPTRDKLLAEQTRRLELANAKTTAELIPAAQIEAEWAEIVATIKGRLAMVPRRVANIHPGHPAIIATLENELNAALMSLADDR